MIHHLSPDRQTWIKVSSPHVSLRAGCGGVVVVVTAVVGELSAVEFPPRPLGASLLHEKLPRETERLEESRREGRRGEERRGEERRREQRERTVFYQPSAA